MYMYWWFTKTDRMKSNVKSGWSFKKKKGEILMYAKEGIWQYLNPIFLS